MSLSQIVAEANLAPSVHNTQPTRWEADGNGAILSLDIKRWLRVCDPGARDARLSMGAALYGTKIAAARRSMGVKGVEVSESEARIEFGGTPNKTWDSGIVARRTTWRRAFAAGPKIDLRVLGDRPDTTVTNRPETIEALARLNDLTSLGILRGQPFRDELRTWMRLSRGHADWSRDGLNAEALGMSGIEAFGAGIVLRSPLFDWLDKAGLGMALVGEATKTKTAHWIVAFHRPEGEDPLYSGEAFYEMWLALTAKGQAAWPMAALADDPDARANVCRLMGVPDGQRLINVLRVGPLPIKAPPKARLDPAELIL